MHLVWDWNGTLLDDIHVVVGATNAALSNFGAPATTVDEHRRDFRRPIIDYYSGVVGRRLSDDEFARLDRLFHESYRDSLATVTLTRDAREAMAAWPGTQSLLSMWFHHELVPAVNRFGLEFTRVDGFRGEPGQGYYKAEFLKAHLTELSLDGEDVVLIGDSVDDYDAAASVGAGCVLYSGGFTHADNLRTCGVPVARSLVEAVTLARP